MTLRGHEHWCYRCFGAGVKKTKNKGGWWRCVDKKCTRAAYTACLEHLPTTRSNAASDHSRSGTVAGRVKSI